jgi:2-dehydro-3-deoxyphosphogluconate aldolase / (4S)-4-hydroxy-2-oxoglutarate aldolase
MPEEFFEAHLSQVPAIAILRGHDPDSTVKLANRCWDAGLALVEVPTQGPAGLAALQAAVAAGRERGAIVGAGTIYRPEDAAQAGEAGAAFLVAPGLDVETVRVAAEWNLPYLPGVLSAMEVQLALAHGLRSVKLFPAGPLGPGWIRAMRGPFPEVGFVAVGGIGAANASAFIEAGAIGVGVGGELGKSDTIEKLAQLNPARRPRSEGARDD